MRKEWQWPFWYCSGLCNNIIIKLFVNNEFHIFFSEIDLKFLSLSWKMHRKKSSRSKRLQLNVTVHYAQFFVQLLAETIGGNQLNAELSGWVLLDDWFSPTVAANSCAENFVVFWSFIKKFSGNTSATENEVFLIVF